MKKTLVIFSLFGITFILLSILVASQVLYSNARLKHTAQEIEQQHSLINSGEENDLIDRIRISNRSIEKGLAILASHEIKLQSTVLLLIADGILCIAFGVAMHLSKNRRRPEAM